MTQPLPTVEQYLAEHPDADPQTMLQVLLAKNASMREENEWRNQEYKTTTEVELDDNLNFKPKTMAQLYRMARMYAESGLVPQHYANNVPGCAIGIQMALRMHVDILTFLQCSFTHKGKIGIEAKLAMARLNTSGKIKGRVSYVLEGEGESRQCTAIAVDVESGATLKQTVTWEMVKAEGWDKPNGTQTSKWKTLTDLMFQYRAGIFLARVHYPDVLLGMYTIDELEDMAKSNGDAGAAVAAGGLEELSERIGASLKPGKRTRNKPQNGTASDAGESQTSQEAPEPTQQPKKQNGSSGQSDTKSTNAAPSTQPKHKSMTHEACREYLTMRWEVESADFDIEKLAEIASGALNPMAYIDSVISGTAENWESFSKLVEGDMTEEPMDDGPAADDVEQVAEEDAREEDTSDVPTSRGSAAKANPANGNRPQCVTDPVPRPKIMELIPAEFERKIIGKRSPEQIRSFGQSEVKGNPDLTNDECAYLLDLCQRRAWQLERNEPTTDRLPK